MQRIFVANEGFEREIARSRAMGYKDLVIEEGLEVFKPIELKTEGTSLVMREVEADENDTEEEVYTVLCDSFGLVGESKGCYAKVSVIFCDNGKMLVTLHDGAMVIDLGGKLMMPSVGIDNLPSVVAEDILWVNADHLLAYSKYLGVKGLFMYDVEFMFFLTGEVLNGNVGFSLKPIKQSDIDLSLGYIAQYEQTQQLKADAREAKRVRNELFKHQQNEFEFDDDEDESDDSEDDDDDDWGDYGM